jgi:23S rRNA (guanosine2251-2'-O)-methyltransferase
LGRYKTSLQETTVSQQTTVFGLHAATALLQRRPQDVIELHHLKARTDQRLQPLIDQARELGIRLVGCDREVLDKLSEEGNHQGLVLKVREAQERDIHALEAALDALDHKPLLLILDGVTDPHNLGACLRSADAAGVDAVIIPRHKAAGLTPVVRKVACGAAEVIPIYAVTNLAQCIDKLRERGIWLVGAAGEAEKSIYETDFRGNTAIVMGAEGDGLRRLTREMCDYLAKIPMAGSVSSLNVSVATGVFLFEALRQRHT